MPISYFLIKFFLIPFLPESYYHLNPLRLSKTFSFSSFYHLIQYPYFELIFDPSLPLASSNLLWQIFHRLSLVNDLLKTYSLFITPFILLLFCALVPTSGMKQTFTLSFSFLIYNHLNSKQASFSLIFPSVSNTLHQIHLEINTFYNFALVF